MPALVVRRRLASSSSELQADADVPSAVCPEHGQCYMTRPRVSSHPVGTGVLLQQARSPSSGIWAAMRSAPVAATSSEDGDSGPGACLGSAEEGQGQNTDSRGPSSRVPTHGAAGAALEAHPAWPQARC